jgi:hypothetical protein
MKLIELNKNFYEFPEKWNELDQKRLLNLVSVMFLKGYTAEKMLLQLIRVLAALSHYQFLRCTPEELEQYFYLVVPYLQEEIEFTKNLVPRFKFKVPGSTNLHEIFYGPDDECSNLKMKEFTFLESAYVRWCESKRQDIDLLNEIVAILYRPAPAGYDIARNEAGDRREPFNENISTYYAKKYVAHWPATVKLAIAIWYGGCRIQITQNYPDLFNTDGEPVREAGAYGLLSVMMNVAESGVFGPFHLVEDQYVNLVLIQLSDMMAKARKLERESKNK